MYVHRYASHSTQPLDVSPFQKHKLNRSRGRKCLAWCQRITDVALRADTGSPVPLQIYIVIVLRTSHVLAENVDKTFDFGNYGGFSRTDIRVRFTFPSVRCKFGLVCLLFGRSECKLSQPWNCWEWFRMFSSLLPQKGRSDVHLFQYIDTIHTEYMVRKLRTGYSQDTFLVNKNQILLSSCH